MSLCGISTTFAALSHSPGQISYVLLTRAPLSTHSKTSFPFDLHVLGTPPAFILSQDQTLRIVFRGLSVFTSLLLRCGNTLVCCLAILSNCLGNGLRCPPSTGQNCGVAPTTRQSIPTLPQPVNPFSQTGPLLSPWPYASQPLAASGLSGMAGLNLVLLVSARWVYATRWLPPPGTTRPLVRCQPAPPVGALSSTCLLFLSLVAWTQPRSLAPPPHPVNALF